MFTIILVAFIISTAAAYPMRNGRLQTGMFTKFLKVLCTKSIAWCIMHTVTEPTCASIGYTTGCCPPDLECKATNGDTHCYCSADCHNYDDCCTDIVDVCPQSE